MNDSLASQRFVSLLRQLRDEEGARHGWKTRVAKRLDLTQPAVFMLLEGRRGVSLETLEKAIARLGLRSEFFFDEALGDEPPYREHLRETSAPPDPPFWVEFMTRYEHAAALTPGEIQDLKHFAARRLRIRSWTDWERVAEMVRVARPSEIFEATHRADEDEQ